MRKRILGLFVLLVVGVTCFAAPDKCNMGFLLEIGMYPQIKQAVARAFPNNKCDADNDQLTIYDVSPDQEAAFVEMLKQLGHNVVAVENNLYRIRMMEGADQEWTLEVNSAAFKSQIQRLMDLQKILGQNVTGGTNDPVKIKKGESPHLWWSLLNANFSYQIADDGGVKRLVVTEREIPVTIYITNPLQRDLVNENFDKAALHIRFEGDKIVLVVSGGQLDEIREKLKAFMGGFNESSVNFTWSFVPAKPKSHRVRVILSKGDNFEAQKANVLSAMNSENAKGDFLVESVEDESIGTKCLMTFYIASYKSTEIIANTIAKLLAPCNVRRNKVSID